MFKFHVCFEFLQTASLFLIIFKILTIFIGWRPAVSHNTVPWMSPHFEFDSNTILEMNSLNFKKIQNLNIVQCNYFKSEFGGFYFSTFL